ncbi:MAG: DUF86 domain-containing protein [Candidatus Thermoplasmatota archaeon]
MKDDSVYLKHILDAITRIESYTEGKNYDDFINNPLIRDGVIRQIEIMGEATKRLSMEMREKYSEIPWKDITAMGDKLIHDYIGIDLDAVWDTVERDIPSLKDKLKTIFEKEYGI